MLITDKNRLKEFRTEKRIWQGIPAIEVTSGGRIFVAFYSGGISEGIGNYALLVKSDDGHTFTEPIAVAYEEGHRCFDPALWIDPLGRLWFTWARHPEDGVFGTICDDPDAACPHFSAPFFIGHNVMMNKPTVLSTGEWLFPLAVWNTCYTDGENACRTKGAYVYATADGGKTFCARGYADVPNRSFDEHMVLERRDGSLVMYVRTQSGIGTARSHDGGKTWGEEKECVLPGPCSRFFIRRLSSGRILLVNNDAGKERRNLTAFLSEDEGETFPYRLLLDERAEVSYPDGKEAADGFLYIVYDRERGGFKESYREAAACAREILLARVRESDILAGSLSPACHLKQTVSKLGHYEGDAEAFYRKN